MVSFRIRPAIAEDVVFLDVVIEATRAQGRLPDDFDEPQWREGFADWTMQQLRGDDPQARKLYDRLGFRQVGETEQECKLRWNPDDA